MPAQIEIQPSPSQAGTWDKFKPSAYEKELGKPLDPAPPSALEPPVAAPAPTPPAVVPASQPEPKGISEEEVEKIAAKNEHFKHVKSQRDTATKRAEDLQKIKDDLEKKYADAAKELETEKKAPKHNAELIATLTRERDEALTKFNEVAFDYLPEVQQKFDGRKAEATAGLKAMIKNADEIIAVLEMPESEHKKKLLNELTAEMGEIEKGEIVATNRDLRKINAEYGQERKKASETISQIAKDRQAKAQERQQSIEKEFQQTLLKMQDAKEGIPGFILREEKTPEDKQFNASVQERVAVARKIFTGQLDAGEMARQAAMAANATFLIEQLKSANTRAEQLEQALAKMQVSSPGITPGGAPPAPDDGKPKSWAEAILGKKT